MPVVYSIGGTGGALVADILVPYAGAREVSKGSVLPHGLKVVDIEPYGVIVVGPDGKRKTLPMGRSVAALPAPPPPAAGPPQASIDRRTLPASIMSPPSGIAEMAAAQALAAQRATMLQGQATAFQPPQLPIPAPGPPAVPGATDGFAPTPTAAPQAPPGPLTANTLNPGWTNQTPTLPEPR